MNILLFDIINNLILDLNIMTKIILIKINAIVTLSNPKKMLDINIISTTFHFIFSLYNIFNKKYVVYLFDN